MSSPKHTDNLQDRLIWLTRPLTQSDGLQAALQGLGARTFVLPLLEIKPVVPDQTTRSRLLDLDQYDLVFYVSSNAARIGLDQIAGYWPQYPAHILNFAVGPTTAEVLTRDGLTVYFPVERMSSEAMLALPQLANITGKRALIVRGVGGREILAEGLSERGARVDYAQLYERACPVYEPAYLLQALQQHAPDAIVVSSAEALDNLHVIFTFYQSWQSLPLCVSSERLAEHALNLGFNRIKILAGATDLAIIDSLGAAFNGKDNS